MSLPRDWNAAGGAIPPRGAERPSIRDILNGLTGMTIAEAKAVPVDERFAGATLVLADGRRFLWAPASVAAADGDHLVIVPTSGAGRWVAAPGFADLEFDFTFATLNAAVLWTVPVGAAMLVQRGYWEVVTPFTGGASSAIGLSSDQAPHTTPGDLLGGAGGDVAATLVAADYIPGTIGADIAAGVILRGGQTLRFDRIVSAFTAGAGKAHLVGQVLSSPT